MDRGLRRSFAVTPVARRAAQDAAERQRRCRERRRSGLRVVQVVVSDELVAAWIDVGLIESDDRQAIAEIAAEVLEEYGLGHA